MFGRFRWVVLGVAVFAFMQAHRHRMALAPLIPRFIADLGLTYVAAGACRPRTSSATRSRRCRGGPGKHSSIVPTFGATRSVTVRVEG